MTKERKNVLTAVLLGMALIQIPLFYYIDEFFLWIIYGFTGLVLTILLLVNILFRWSSNSLFHVFGLLGVILIIGSMNITSMIMINFDFNIQKAKRLEVVKQVKNGTLKKGNRLYDELLVNKNEKGIVSVEFYIHKGILGSYSSFLYTNDPKEINGLDEKLPNETVKKLEKNWYLIRF